MARVRLESLKHRRVVGEERIGIAWGWVAVDPFKSKFCGAHLRSTAVSAAVTAAYYRVNAAEAVISNTRALPEQYGTLLSVERDTFNGGHHNSRGGFHNNIAHKTQ